VKDINYSIPRTRLFFNNYLPGAIMAHRDGMYGFVVGTNSREEQVEKVNRELLKEVIREQSELWENMGGEVDGNLSAAIESDNIIVRAPDEISIRPMPLMLECRKCKLIQQNAGRADETIARLSNLASGDRPFLNCPNCRGLMKQIRFVNIHRCGAVNAITPPYSARGKHLLVRDGGTFYTTYWVDHNSGQNYGNLIAPKCQPCANIDRQGNNTRGAVLRDGRSEVFYPRLTQYISMTEVTTELLENAMSVEEGLIEVGRAVLCGLLEVMSQSTIRSNLIAMVEGENGNDDIESLVGKRKGLVQQLETLQSIDGMAEMVAVAKESIDNLDEQIERAKGLFAVAGDYISDRSYLIGLAASRRARESALFPGEFDALSMDDLPAQERDPNQRVIIEAGVQQIRQQRAVIDVRYIKDVSVVLAAVGFSRELDNPSVGAHEVPVKLNAFIDEVNDDLSGKTPVYVLPANTEALHVQMSPSSILAWAQESLGWVIDDQSIIEDRRRAHSFILQAAPLLRSAPSVAYNEAKRTGDHNSLNILGLIHTVSHLLMRSAKPGSGYDENSLMEYMFPADLSFLIYVASTTDYTTGGLLSLFRHSLTEWFEKANVDSISCLYDPICSETGGSCHGCTQKSITCETFNHGLSRTYIRGGSIRYQNGQIQQVSKGIWDE